MYELKAIFLRSKFFVQLFISFVISVIYVFATGFVGNMIKFFRKDNRLICILILHVGSVLPF